MISTWFVLLVGLASSATALDASYIAETVIAGLDATLTAHASEWFSLPGFDISFNNKNESKWHIHYGQLASKIGGVKKDKYGNEPEIVHFTEDSDSVFIPINIKNLVVEYKFSCEDFFEISGYNYSISRTVPTQATILVDIVPEGPTQCRGVVHSTPGSFSYEEDGSDFSKITPDNQYAKQCIVRSYTKKQDYTDRLTVQFENDVYEKAVEKMLFTATQAVLSNLNLCAK